MTTPTINVKEFNQNQNIYLIVDDPINGTQGQLDASDHVVVRNPIGLLKPGDLVDIENPHLQNYFREFLAGQHRTTGPTNQNPNPSTVVSRGAGSSAVADCNRYLNSTRPALIRQAQNAQNQCESACERANDNKIPYLQKNTNCYNECRSVYFSIMGGETQAESDRCNTVLGRW